MTPSTTMQNLVLWGAAFMGAVILSALSAVATHWPVNGSIDWRGVTLDVIQTILSTAPLVVAGLGLPRLGHEPVAALVSQVGTANAQAALETEAVKQAVGGASDEPFTPEQVDQIAGRLLELRAEHEPPADDDAPPSGGVQEGPSGVHSSGLISQPPRFLNRVERTAGEQTVDIVSRAVADTPPLPPEQRP
jgi:hypothetical protein